MIKNWFNWHLPNEQLYASILSTQATTQNENWNGCKNCAEVGLWLKMTNFSDLKGLYSMFNSVYLRKTRVITSISGRFTTKPIFTHKSPKHQASWNPEVCSYTIIRFCFTNNTTASSWHTKISDASLDNYA